MIGSHIGILTGRPGGGARMLCLVCVTGLLVLSVGDEARGQTCGRVVSAEVVALDQPFFWNRLGASEPQGMVFALLEDVVAIDGGQLSAGNARLRTGKRPRPMVLRMNAGDCLRINFQNLLSPSRVHLDQPATRTASVRAIGLQLVDSIASDGSNVGTNASSLVPPGGLRTYTFFAEREGTHMLYSAAANTGGGGNGGSLNAGLFGAVNVEPSGAEWYRSQVTRNDIQLATTGSTTAGHPLLDYDAVYPPGHVLAGRPIFKMLDNGNKLRHSDLTAVITGPGRASFPAGTYPPNPVYPDRDQSFREYTIVYHDEIEASQVFNDFQNPVLKHTLKSVRDAFAINYGTAGIGAEILSNRRELGPMHDCTDCKYEEFFLSSWAVGDPAMIVDIPANGDANTGPKATMALFPDDPSNVYHSYLGDHVKFRLLHAGPAEFHIHHLHAHQWLYTPDNDNSAYLDSQAIGPGAAFTLEIPYRGSGNRNQTVGDSIFHCHFYPHFAQGMWSLWRVHDVFEQGTLLDTNGRPAPGARALPDGEISVGTPIPAVVPIPGLVMAPMPEADVDIVQIPGRPGGQIKITGTGNPGFPFFIAGVAGHRPPHPPLDTVDDGGLPRHVVTGGTTMHIETRLDFTKDFLTLQAVELPEAGTAVEQAAMSFHAQRLHESFTTDGIPADYVVNGLPAVAGAPYADPCIDDLGNSIGEIRTYKAADIQMDLVLNKLGWHFPQTRLTALWGDVMSTLDGTKPPEPLFMRANTNDCLEYQLTNLVPNYYEMDDFQVRTPTDVLGQHIHLVKFDVTSSDGSANGYNYEDGSFSPDEVRERIGAIRAGNSCMAGDPRDGTFECPVAQPHPFFGPGPEGAWIGAQTTVQRWFADDVLNNLGEDRTLRTVFTHDHFGPSTHQQAGLYAGLVVEPAGSTWRHSETGETMGTRGDGGPTSFRADILTADPSHSFREFLLEFADTQLAYKANSQTYPDPANAINAPAAPPDFVCPGGVPAPCPEAVSSVAKGTVSVNYRNEPLGKVRGDELPGTTVVSEGRLIDPATQSTAMGMSGDAAHVFRSIVRADPALNVQPSIYPALTADVEGTDPFTPLLRVYENDPVQIRTLVGAHAGLHHFSVHGTKWLLEPSDVNSGFRNSQPMGISEHFEFAFTVPPSDDGAAATDYLYLAGTAGDDLNDGGIWGLLRAYDGDVAIRGDLQTLPNNPTGSAAFVNAATFTGVCPNTAPVRQYSVTAVTAEQSLPGATLVYNARITNGGPIHDPQAMLLFRTEELDSALQPLPETPIEPLILRANAGDCIEVTLNNAMDPAAVPFAGWKNASTEIALHPQLVAFDVKTDNGVNAGANPVQTISPGFSRTYRWYAGTVQVNPDGTRTAVPVEFGATNLMPADPIEHAAKGLVGALIIEPQGSTWVEDANSRASATVTKSDGSSFREFVLLFQDDVGLHPEADFGPQKFSTAINYRTEPMWQRIGYDPNSTTLDQTGSMDLTNALSNAQVGGDPVTPVFTAAVGEGVRFRVLHPGGSLDHVFEVHGHIWEREPYINASTEIGENSLSEWEGARVGIGAAGHFDAVLKHGAGGAFGVPGDYLYRAFTSFEFDAGVWGIFRVSCNSSAECDDGLFCNGQETCFVESCLPGIAVDCDDGVACTLDSCNDMSDSCDHTPDDMACDDGLACNGPEVCDPVLGCLGGDPCLGLSTADLSGGLTPTNLVNSLAGFVGATVPDISNVTYTGANAAAGTFSGGSGIIGFFDSGIVLGTGVIADVIGPNTADDTTTDHGTAGDVDLDFVTGGTTSDAAALEFDFICPGLGSTIVFDYVLASESYNEFVGSPPTTTLGLFLNGTNLAVLQNGITPVSTETVHCGNPYAPPGGGTECDQYVNNDCNDIPPGTFPCEGNLATEMDGMTTVLTARGDLLPGVNQINHLKLVIADTAPGVPDSAVFILAGSFECLNADFPPVPRSLKAIPAPEPDNLMEFVMDRDAAIALGKSLFWDMQTGGDGMQACATCHFQAGADARVRNTLHPGGNGVFSVGGPNYTLQPTDFPFASVPSPLDADDVVGSQGVVRREFTAVVPGSVEDDGIPIPDPVYHVAGVNTRRVTGRNTPPVINAIYNVRSFWDGRGNFVFNGVNSFGSRDPGTPTILEVQPDGTLLSASVAIEKASLASQAVGPPNSDTEMSWNGRTFPELGRKLLSLQPLARQMIDSTDSVLGGMVDPSGRGLVTTYEAMIQNAFWGKYWDSNALTGEGFTVMEANFSLFFGLAIQLYEATLVSDDSPFDRFRDGDPNALTQQQKDGFDVFMGPGLCVLCHKGAEFTGASHSALLLLGRFETELLEPMIMGDGTPAVYDSGFYNIGVRPTGDDLGAGGTDPFGNPLSFTRLSQQGVDIGPPFNFPVFIDPLQRTAVDGSFKVPSLRNVELTGPYMHNGGMETLEQVVEFYARGGDFPDVNIANLAPLIQTLPLTALDRANLVAFMKSLTDERVRLQEAPFDHPQIFLPHGHLGDDVAVASDGNGAGVDCLVELPAVGANGMTPAPLSTECLVLCGNGVIDFSENCDDGNLSNGDCCSSTCQFETLDAPCASGIPCAGGFCDGVGSCQAEVTTCTNSCEQCNPGVDACDWCAFDHNFSGATDGLDFAFFSGCFGGCYSSADPCIVANYDQDVFGCVGGGDFGGFTGCFGLTCGQCDNCWGPAGGNPNAGLPGDESASGIRLAVQLVAVTLPTLEDFAPTLPSSVERFEVNESVELEIWVRREDDGVVFDDGLASVYVDLHYDPRLLWVQEIVPAASFEIFGRGEIGTKGRVEAVGGCTPLGDGRIASDGEWARVATVNMGVGSQGTAAVTVAPAFRPFGVSLHGRLGDVPSSQIKFGGVTLKLGSAGLHKGRVGQARIPRGRD